MLVIFDVPYSYTIRQDAQRHILGLHGLYMKDVERLFVFSGGRSDLL
jgi:hypothetical protein